MMSEVYNFDVLKGQEKMSKSDPNSAIFMEDSEADVNAKIKRAFCPPEEVDGNPCISYVRHIVLPWFGHFTITRKPENGGDRQVQASGASFAEIIGNQDL